MRQPTLGIARWLPIATSFLITICPGTTAVTAAAAVIQLEPIVTGLASPIYVTSAKDGTDRRFIVEQGGVIKVLQPGATTPSVFLDITTRVLSGGERGLLGLAFHPRYAVNGRFFVNYTRQPDGATVIAEYGVSDSDPNIADSTETVLLTFAQPFANHNGGMIEFGPDGFLYIGTGDGGSANDPGNRAQNIDEFLGKILRIDVDHPNGMIPYSSPSDNPFFGATAGRDEIYATGMRNPWRFSFDRATGDLYVGDVGQGAWEEVDLVTLGGNYGWRLFEGNHHCTNLAGCDATGLTFPIAEYGHTGGRCSITGGYVYRGVRSTLPTGTYVYGDYCTGEVFTLTGSAQALALDTSLNVSSFGEDEAGELYVVGLGGTVHRLTTSPPPPPCSYSIAPAGQSFGDSGGVGSLNLTTAGDCGWLAASHAEWITITSPAAGAGSAALTYAVAPNGGTGPRTGTIAVGGQILSVAQGAGCTFAIDPPSQHVSSGGGNSGVDMTAPSGCSWTAQSRASWITVTSGSAGGGSGRVAYAVATNTGHSARTGTMLIAGLTFTVTQDGAPTLCSYSISPNKRNAGASGGTGAVTIKTRSGCAWSAQSQANWITITSGDNGTGRGTLTYAIAPNTSGVARTGTLTIAGRSFIVKQGR